MPKLAKDNGEARPPGDPFANTEPAPPTDEGEATAPMPPPEPEPPSPPLLQQGEMAPGPGGVTPPPPDGEMTGTLPEPPDEDHPTAGAILMTPDQRVMTLGPAPVGEPVPDDEHSEAFRMRFGQTPGTAQADLARAMEGTGAATPTHVTDARRERWDATLAERAANPIYPTTATDVVDLLAPMGTDANLRDRLGADQARLEGASFGTWIESRTTPGLKYQVSRNTSDTPIALETAPGVFAYAQPGDYVARDVNGNTLVMLAGVVHEQYRPSPYGPNMERIF